MQVSYDNQGLRHAEVFTDVSEDALRRKMDVRKAELEARGHTRFNRVKLGRNAKCPCDSGKKFKHCCIDKSR